MSPRIWHPFLGKRFVAFRCMKGTRIVGGRACPCYSLYLEDEWDLMEGKSAKGGYSMCQLSQATEPCGWGDSRLEVAVEAFFF